MRESSETRAARRAERGEGSEARAARPEQRGEGSEARVACLQGKTHSGRAYRGKHTAAVPTEENTQRPGNCCLRASAPELGAVIK